MSAEEKKVVITMKINLHSTSCSIIIIVKDLSMNTSATDRRPGAVYMLSTLCFSYKYAQLGVHLAASYVLQVRNTYSKIPLTKE